jgi:hypothetical protein
MYIIDKKNTREAAKISGHGKMENGSFYCRGNPLRLPRIIPIQGDHKFRATARVAPTGQLFLFSEQDFRDW